MNLLSKIISHLYLSKKAIVGLFLIIILLGGCANKEKDREFETYFYRSLHYINIARGLNDVDLERKKSFFAEEYTMELAQRIAREDCRRLKKRVKVVEKNETKIDFLQKRGEKTAQEIEDIKDIDRAIYLAGKLSYCPKFIDPKIEIYKTIQKNEF
ncbi:MAG: hypothetical protein QNJ38_17075 [Prochloraceae cyanobacterium]|nr:hypothetical protein [Prochloraceae cyanobacterium]